jgi:predicted metal-dependent phosphoesterase TrpH
VASLAHPGLLGRDEIIPELVAAGLGAIEVFHSDHDGAAEIRYQRIARDHGLVMTGGSDYHRDDHRRAGKLGHVGPSRQEYERLVTRISEARQELQIAD